MTATTGIGHAKYRIGGMDCAACARKIETAVARLPGVAEVGVSPATGTMRVAGGEAARIAAQVEALGYSIQPGDTAPQAANHDRAHAAAPADRWWQAPGARLTLACGAALLLAAGLGLLAPGLGHWPYLAALAVGLVPVARRALAAARAGTPFSIETLMTVAATGAVFIGAIEEAAMVVLLFLIGEMLEGLAARRARAGISALTRLVPATALVERGDTLVETPGADLAPGMVIAARPGDRIAADGEVVAGRSAVDEAAVTGESIPAAKAPGDTVYAGTINTEAVLRIRVTSRAGDNTIARILRLVEEAQESKAPTARFIDRFASRYTPAVMALAVLVAVLPPLLAGQDWGEWVYRGLALLLIGCPCALVISTPAAIAAGLSAGARRGLLLKGGAVLEGLRRVTAAAFDKTGTLTTGRPVVTDIEGFGHGADEVLALAAALEQGSSHPLARAILTRAGGAPPAADIRALPGEGVAGTVGGRAVALLSPRAAEGLTPEQSARIAALAGEGKTVSVLTVDARPAGLIALRDELRPDAVAALARLKAAGIESVMLTGDNAATAGAIAAQLGIAAHAELLPQDKSRIVADMQRAGHIVAKVGDGINDAPALARADIGISMGGGADVALETADAAALHGRMADIPAMIALSEATMRNIRQNIAMALGLKAVFLVTTIAGITGLWPAILADTGATVLVTANAMRLLAWKGS